MAELEVALSEAKNMREVREKIMYVEDVERVQQLEERI